MKRRAAITAASAVTLAVLGGGIAVAAGSGLFGSPPEPGAGRLPAVLDPASLSAPLEQTSALADTPANTPVDKPVAAPSRRSAGAVPRAASGDSHRTAPAPQPRNRAAAGETVGDNGAHPGDASDVTGRTQDDRDNAHDDATEPEVNGHNDDD